MSGGSMDYLYRKVDDAADCMRNSPNLLRRAFSEHLKLVAAALHDVEWVDSCDMGSGDEDSAIRAVVSPTEEAATLKHDLESLLVRADSVLERL